MTTKEGRFIMLGMMAGAIAGGLFILYTRMKAINTQPPIEVKPTPSIDWADVFSIGGAAIILARRIATLVENPELKANDKPTKK
jgi:formate/nitrite transporter FocA (FNT family)